MPAAPVAPGPQPSTRLAAQGSRRGGPTCVLERETRRASPPKARQPLTDRVRVPPQCCGHLHGRPAFRQQPQRVPALPLARRPGAIPPLPDRTQVQLPSFQSIPHVVHPRTSPLAPRSTSLPRSPSVFQLGFGLGLRGGTSAARG